MTIQAKQREYLCKAGEAAQAAYANEAALDYYERFLLLVSAPAEQIDLYLKCGTVLKLAGRLDEAETAEHSALALAEKTPTPMRSARCQQALGGLYCLRGDYVQALTQLGQARIGWQTLNASEELGRTLGKTGEVLYRMGEFQAAHQSLSEALDLARTAKDRAYAFLNLGIVALIRAMRL